MLVMVTGGASSGKSAFAESLALALPAPHWYVATMRSGPEAQARIARHRTLRAGKGFRTIEMEHPCTMPSQGTLLLEDLGNLVANGWEQRIDEVLTCENVVVVGNEVGCDGICYEDFTAAYLVRLGALACRITARADLVAEVVGGVPHVLKGNREMVASWAS